MLTTYFIPAAIAAFVAPAAFAAPTARAAEQPLCHAELLPPQPGVVCETRGFTVKNEGATETAFIAGSFDECRDLAAPRTPATIEWRPIQQRCVLFYQDRALDRAVNVTASDDSTHVIADGACYNCPLPQCPPPDGLNLLANPGFEKHPIGPWYTTAAGGLEETSPQEVSPGVDSYTALYLPAASRRVSQEFPFPCAENRLFSFSFDFMTDASDDATISGSTGDYIYTKDGRASESAWVTYKDYIVPSTDFVDATPTASFLGELVTIDNVKVEALFNTTFSPIADAPELIVNGGFETNVPVENNTLPPPWLVESDEFSQPNFTVHPIGKSLQYILDVEFAARFSQPGIRLEQGHEYLISFNYEVLGNGGDTYQSFVSYSGDAGNVTFGRSPLTGKGVFERPFIAQGATGQHSTNSFGFLFYQFNLVSIDATLRLDNFGIREVTGS